MTRRPRVSFDLDDTLICQPAIPAEPPPPFWRRWLTREPLRRGAVELIQTLRNRRCSIWIYTTSYRSPSAIRRWGRAYGLCFDGIVTLTEHDRIVGRSGPSKYPPAFGIDLHVDDLPGVAIEGKRHSFATIIVAPDDPDWSRPVLAAVDQQLIQQRKICTLVVADADVS